MATGAEAHWEVLGQLSEASNATLLVELSGQRFVYKPVRGERPLWDFPDSTLGRREVAAFEVSRRLGWDLVPRTRWVSDGPFGPGSLQDWVDGASLPVGVFPAGKVPDGWLSVLSGADESDKPLEVAHRDNADLRRMALFDLLINNADRKGGHLFQLADGSLQGIDQGLCFHHEPKVRTVLWGFVGEPIADDLVLDLREARSDLPDLLTGLSSAEAGALGARVDVLLARPMFPGPVSGPAIPWPPL